MKTNLNSIILCLFEIVVGILLLVDPVGFTTGIITVAGIVLIAVGVISVIRYFKANPYEAAAEKCLARGLIFILAGGFCAFNSHWFIATFPALTLIYGIAILVSGLGKVQLTVDLIRGKNKKWFFGAISAALSVVSGIVILKSPFASTAVLWMFTGITLVIEAVIDLVTLIVSGNEAKAVEEE